MIAIVRIVAAAVVVAVVGVVEAAVIVVATMHIMLCWPNSFLFGTRLDTRPRVAPSRPKSNSITDQLTD